MLGHRPLFFWGRKTKVALLGLLLGTGWQEEEQVVSRTPPVQARKDRAPSHSQPMQRVSLLSYPQLASPEPHPGRACRMSLADSRVGLKISIAYGFNQLLCHFDNFLFAHCKVGEDTNNNNGGSHGGTKHQLPSPGQHVPGRLCGDLTRCTDHLTQPFAIPGRERDHEPRFPQETEAESGLGGGRGGGCRSVCYKRQRHCLSCQLSLTSKHHGGRSDSGSCLKPGFDPKTAILICCVNRNNVTRRVITGSHKPGVPHRQTWGHKGKSLRLLIPCVV